jgi:Na+/H+-dicarboxylate symporter
MTIYAMKRILFKAILGVLTVTCLALGIFLTPNQAQAFQDPSTPTGVFITVTYTEQMNVRNGPGTSYDILGQIQPGSIYSALGISPGREWIQIAYPPGPNGIGWVYASYVSISGGELRVVEPPPTQTPLVTSTFDPTLAAAFIIQPTQTRMPTFTPPPPLTIPQFTETGSVTTPKIPSGIFVVTLGILGSVGLVISFILRKQ